MQTIQDIFLYYNLTDTEINRLSSAAKHNAIDCGKKGIIKNLPPDIWDLFDEMSQKVWQSTMDTAQKISVGFQLYDTFPDYHHFLTPYYYAISKKEIINQNEKELIWKQFMNYLASEKCYADPVGYVLWVEFFEDSSTVAETWKGLLNYSNKNSLLRLLEQAGPVPFDLKEPVYNSLIIDKKYHELIFTSLLYSAYDIYGQIDKEKATTILTKLEVDIKTEKYKLLKDKLQ